MPSIRGGQKQAVYCNTCFCEGPTAETETGAVEARNRRIASVPAESYVHEKAVLVAATQIRRLASAASPVARYAYIKAAEAVEMAVSAARPAVSGG